MSVLKNIAAVLGLVSVLTGSAAGRAQAEDYVAASWPALMRTMVRFNALSLDDPTIIDEYTIITECDLYKAFYHDDFKWNQVRQAVRESVKLNLATFPINYHYDVKLDLDRYDFDAKVYRFTERSAIHNVNTFLIYSVESSGCGAADIKYVPRIYRAVLSSPVFLDSLPLGKQDAEALLKQMETDHNTNRTVYARFNLRMVYIDHLQKETTHSGVDLMTRYKQGNVADGNSVRLDARLDSVDFYEDPAMTRLIYQYKPNE